MTFGLFWAIAATFAVLGLIGCHAWWFRHPYSRDANGAGLDSTGKPIRVSLWGFLLWLAAALCPLLQYAVCIGIFVYFAAEIAPNITLFGSK